MYSIIKVSGSEATKFLQGQLSNDLIELADSSWQFSCYCNQKGRIIAFLWVFKQQDTYYLCLPSSALELTITELKKFGAFSKVLIEEDKLLKCHPLCKVVTPELLSECFATMTYGNEYSVSLLLADNNLQLTPCEDKDWRMSHIFNKLPIITEETQEMFTPHQLDLQLKNAFSLKKGCYRGQEIIARMHYLGKLKHYLGIAEIHSETAPTPGTKLATHDEMHRLKIVNQVQNAPHEYLVLAIIPNALKSPDNKVELSDNKKAILK